MPKISNIPIQLRRHSNQMLRERCFILNVISQIKACRALLHRIKLSGDYIFHDITFLLGDLAIAPNYPSSNTNMMPNYSKKFYMNLGGKLFTIFTEPMNPYLPNCIIDIVSPSVSVLKEINESLPGLKCSYVEVAIDLKCSDSRHADLVFYLMKRYLYIPFISRLWSFGESGFDIERPSKINAGLSYSTKRKGAYGNKHFRMYQRGAKSNIIYSKNGKPYYNHRDINTVRLEGCFKRKSQRFKRLRISALNDFIYNPSFTQLFLPHYKGSKAEIQFVNFRANRNLPQPYDYYTSTGAFGVENSIQQELISRRKIGNIYQHLEDTMALKPLLKRIKRALNDLDSRWLI